MSAKTSKTPKSAAETLSRVETEDVEEHQEPSAYDRLPAVIATFPAIFKDLEVEQRDRREIDEQRIRDLNVVANALLARVEKEEQARIDADLSVEKIYQQGITMMYKNVRAPMRTDFANIGSEIIVSNERLALAMKQLRSNVEESEIERAEMKRNIIQGGEFCTKIVQETTELRQQQMSTLASLFLDELRQLRMTCGTEKINREREFVPMRHRCYCLEHSEANMNKLAMQQISDEIQVVHSLISKNHQDKLHHWMIVRNTIEEYCVTLETGLKIVNSSEPVEEKSRPGTALSFAAGAQSE